MGNFLGKNPMEFSFGKQIEMYIEIISCYKLRRDIKTLFFEEKRN